MSMVCTEMYVVLHVKR